MMSIANDPNTALTLTITEEERSQLLNWLEQYRRDKLVEEHRTDAPNYRSFILRQEEILDKLILKLRRD